MDRPSTVVSSALQAVLAPVALARRSSPGPLLVRLIAVLAALAVVVVAAPAELLIARLPAFAVIGVTGALAIGLFPRSRFVGLYLLGTVGLWLITTLAYAVQPGLIRVGTLAGLLYLTHAAAGFAAAVPYDCVLSGRVLGRWAGRVATVLVGGVGVAVGGTAAAGLLESAPSVVGPVAGSLVAAALAGLLVWQLRRRF